MAMPTFTTNQIVGLQAYGAISSAIGTYYSSKAQKEDLSFQARMAEINARQAEASAQSALLAGQREEQKAKLATANVKSQQRAGMAANGVDLGVGSAVNVLSSTDLIGEVDANTIKANAIASAWGYRTQGANYAGQAARSSSAARAVSPMANAGTSLIDGASRVAGSWYVMNKGVGMTQGQ